MLQKSPDAFRTISEVAESLDVPQHVLRFWEGKFPQIKPLKRAGGRRYYRPDDIDLLRGVRALLYGEGYTIKGVQKVLRDSGIRYVADIGRLGLKKAIRGAGPTLHIVQNDTSASLVDAEIDDDTSGEVVDLKTSDFHDHNGMCDEAVDFTEGNITGAEDDAEIEPVSLTTETLVYNEKIARTGPESEAGLLASQRARLETALQELLALRDLISPTRFKASAAE